MDSEIDQIWWTVKYYTCAYCMVSMDIILYTHVLARTIQALGKKYLAPPHLTPVQEAILDQQQSERMDTRFKRLCLFCGLVVTGNRAPLFQHMLDDHNFNVGQPDNLGNVNTYYTCTCSESCTCMYV